jgi:hypothetical protein
MRTQGADRRRRLPKRMEGGGRGSFAGSKRAANACNGSARHWNRSGTRRKKPYEQSDLGRSVVHPVALELACHGGGRGFESRRFRVFSTNYLQIGMLCCPPRRKRRPAFFSSRVYPARDFPGNPRRKPRAPGNPRKPEDRPTWPEVCSRSSKKEPVCRDFVTADNGSSPPRGSRARSSARQTRHRRRDREPPRPTHLSRSDREELLRAAVRAPETRTRLLPVESLVYEAEHDGVRGVHEMTAFDPLDLGRGHCLGHEVRHLRERRRRVLAGDD